MITSKLLYRICLVGTILTCMVNASFGQTEKQDDQKKTDAPKQAPKMGRDRWLVKTASDKDATKIKQKPVKTTIEKLLALSRPSDMPLDTTAPKYQESRAQPVETTVYSVEADIIQYQKMGDGDYRVILKGASGQTLVLEMPDPSPEFTDPKSPFAYALKSAREQFNTKFSPVSTAQTTVTHARVTGIGYFGRAFRKTVDTKGNLIQLHPVLDIQWMDQPSKEFMKAKEAEEKKKAKNPTEDTKKP